MWNNNLFFSQILTGGVATIQRAEIESFHAKQTQRLGPMKMTAGGHFVGGGSGGAGSSGGGGDLSSGYVVRPATSNVSIHPQDDVLQQSTSRSYTNLPYTHQVMGNQNRPFAPQAKNLLF